MQDLYMKHIQNNKMPVQAEANNMMLPDVPKIIQDLIIIKLQVKNQYNPEQIPNRIWKDNNS